MTHAAGSRAGCPQGRTIASRVAGGVVSAAVLSGGPIGASESGAIFERRVVSAPPRRRCAAVCVGCITGLARLAVYFKFARGTACLEAEGAVPDACRLAELPLRATVHTEWSSRGFTDKRRCTERRTEHTPHDKGQAVCVVVSLHHVTHSPLSSIEGRWSTQVNPSGEVHAASSSQTDAAGGGGGGGGGGGDS